MKSQSLFSGENKEKYLRMLSAEIFTKHKCTKHLTSDRRQHMKDTQLAFSQEKKGKEFILITAEKEFKATKSKFTFYGRI